MILTRLSLSNPVAAMVAVLLVVLFGILSQQRLPVQLTPEVEVPEITINTNWRAAAPEEVEAEIIEPQEKVLRGLPGMTELVSKAQRGRGSITVKFIVGFDIQRALLEVLNRLNRVPHYPDDADEPVLSNVGGDSRAIAWFIISNAEGNERDIATYKNYVEEVVQTRFERVPGVALSEVFGGREQEIRITFDPYKMASLGIELPEAAKRAAGNEDVSAGTVDVGKRRYSIRFAGKFAARELGDLILDWRDNRPVLLRDVAVVERRMVDRTNFVLTKGRLAIAVNAHRENGVNVLDVMTGLQQAVTELEQGPLKRANLTINQVYDETIYIYSAIELLRNNLLLGILLAVGVLWWFMRRLRATLIVAMAIPLSLLVAFIVMRISGATLNVISLAGLAFAVGMVLDAAIVVLENIVRLRESGEQAEHAALKGASQVWGALLASTVTTVAIFLPVVFLKDEAGQLFADLALTIAVAVTASLVVALTIVPTAAGRWLAKLDLHDPHEKWWDSITSKIMQLTDTPTRRYIWIAGLVFISLTLTLWLRPSADYLPEGNRNLVFTFINPPPGMSINTIEREMGQVIVDDMAPYLSGEKQPEVEHYFFVAFPQGVFMGAVTKDRDRVGELVPIINNIVGGFPDTIAFAFKASLFGGFGGGRSIDMNIQGRNLETLLKAAQVAFARLHQAIPGARVRPFPGLQLAAPELRLIPNERRIAEAGWNRQIMAQVIQALGQGLYIGDYFDGEQRLDIIVRTQPWQTPEELAAIPLTTPSGILPVSELVDVVRTAGPNEVRRLDRRRTVTLQVKLPEGMTLEEGLEIIKTNVEPTVSNMLSSDGEIRYSGTADKLETALRSMSESFILAVIILYLLMSALFRSFLDSILVILALPLATVGGVIALVITDLFLRHIAPLAGIPASFQPMDLLTMIGFIILLGLVVNNAILLVYQARASERQGLSRRDAVEQAVRIRLRPILMSTLTSIFGMLPLLLIPGAGAELYRGLAAVIVGGMSVSTVFTLILLPSLLRMGKKPAVVTTA